MKDISVILGDLGEFICYLEREINDLKGKVANFEVRLKLIEMKISNPKRWSDPNVELPRYPRKKVGQILTEEFPEEFSKERG